MSIARLLHIIIFFSLLSFTTASPPGRMPLIAGMDASSNSISHELTISYSILLKSKRSSGIGETYNGGVKTLFMNDQQIRLRLVSLMRMQSIYILQNNTPGQRIVILKESGKNRYKMYLTDKEWQLYNQKYAGITCQPTGDSAIVLNYPCRKAILTLKNGEKITAWYTPAIQQASFARAEPAFSGVPGLVLQYEYKYRKGTITYTATSIDKGPIDLAVFAVPGKEVPVKKYTPGT
jgi:GLPGLI family protein